MVEGTVDLLGEDGRYKGRGNVLFPSLTQTKRGSRILSEFLGRLVPCKGLGSRSSDSFLCRTSTHLSSFPGSTLQNVWVEPQTPQTPPYQFSTRKVPRHRSRHQFYRYGQGSSSIQCTYCKRF